MSTMKKKKGLLCQAMGQSWQIQFNKKIRVKKFAEKATK